MATTTGHPGQLPAEGNDFVGRGEELAWLRRMDAADERLVSVIGPPGAGKTRLAVRFASSAPLPSRFVDLSGVSTSAEALRAIAGALGLVGNGRDDPFERVGAALAGLGACRLVLDNAETVQGEIGGAIELWLERAPAARLLVTSRQRLGLVREIALELGGLRADEGASLFVARLGRLDPGRSLDRADPQVIEKLVRRLDAMPLALELAAARGRDLSLAQLLDALERRHGFLRDAARRPARHGSLHLAFAECWRRLAPDTAGALAALSVLRGRFDLDAAQAVLGDDADAVAILGALIDRSLVTVQRELGGVARYRLYESLRDVAAERLAPPRAAAVATRHVLFFAARAAALAEAVSGPAPLEALARLEHDADNLLAALREVAEPAARVDLVRGLDALLADRGPYELHERVLGESLERVENGALRAELLRMRGRARLLRGWPRKALGDLEAAHALAAAAGDAGLIERCTDALVPALRQTGALARAAARTEERLLAARRAGDTHGVATALYLQGGNELCSGATEQALHTWLDGLAAAREAGAARLEGSLLANLALACFNLGRREAAEAWSDRAFAALERTGSWATANRVLANRAAHLLEAGLLDEGERWLRLLEERLVQNHDGEIDAVVHFCKARIALARGDMDIARAQYEEAVAISRSCGVAHLAVEFQEELAGLSHDPARTLEIDMRARTFAVQGGAPIRLARRAALWRIVCALCERHGADLPLSVQELVELGWPGEQMLPESGAERVYTAVRTLRRMGLEPTLLTREGGYLLDPAMTVRRLP